MALIAFSFPARCPSPLRQTMARDGFFRGWTAVTLAPIVLNGLGGILVGLVMKYAGGVQKGFSISA